MKNNLLIYSFLENSAQFPIDELNPLCYRIEFLESRESALCKARYITNHSKVYNLSIFDVERCMDDKDIRRWIEANKSEHLSPASEAEEINTNKT